MGSDADYIAPQSTPVDHEALRTSIADVWRSLFSEEPSDDAVAILLAQSALETASWARCMNWNLGGIKSVGAGLHTYYTTTERVPRGTAERMVEASTNVAPCEVAEDDGGLMVTVRVMPNHPACCFRAYRSLGESATGYVALLARRYSASIAAARAGDVRGFVHALKAGGYFTADEDAYAAGVSARFDSYQQPCLATQGEVCAALERLGYQATDNYRSALMQFQIDRMSPTDVDGMVGPRTRAAIRAAILAAA